MAQDEQHSNSSLFYTGNFDSLQEMKPSLPKACKLEAQGLLDVGTLPVCFLLYSAVWPWRLRRQAGSVLLTESRKVREEELSIHLYEEVATHLVWDRLACCSLAEIIATDTNSQWADKGLCEGQNKLPLWRLG